VQRAPETLYSNFAVNNKDDCLKPHHVGYLINRVMTHGTTNIKFIIACIKLTIKSLLRERKVS
jgi:hypothetical protein